MQPDMEGFRLLGESLRNPSRDDEEVVDRSGHHWRVRRQPRAGVRLTMERLDGPGTGLTIYEPGIERPEGYPEELPFMEGAVATVGGMPTNPAARMVIWSEMADARALAQAVQDAGAEEGWEVTRALEELGGFPIAFGESRKGEQRRIISVMSAGAEPAVTLMQTSEDEASGRSSRQADMP